MRRLCGMVGLSIEKNNIRIFCLRKMGKSMIFMGRKLWQSVEHIVLTNIIG